MKACLLLGVVLLLAVPVGAQTPVLTEVFPPGAQAGASQDASVAGTGLAGATAVLAEEAGVRVETRPGGSATKCPLRITVEKGAQPGPREVRLVTPNGVSNAALIWVGRYPDLVEKEPNDFTSPPQVVDKTPCTVSGQAGKAEDVDCYAFQAAAGETWVFALNAADHRSRLDGFLQLRTDSGRLLGSAMTGFDRDPRLVHTFRQAGRYVIRVRDSMHRGGPGFTYRLSLGKLPVVTRYTPIGGQRGTTVNVRLAGVNLAGTAPVPVQLPAEGDDPVRVIPVTSLGPANPIQLFPGSAPEAVEHEPNNGREAAVRLAGFPWAVSGRIEKSGDRDVYSFAACEKQTVLLDVIARRIDSRLDSVLRVLDAAGKELASNDDGAGRDARLSFTAPAAGEYFVEVRSLSGRGGDDFHYRLELRPPPPPSFSLTVTPDNPAAPLGAATVITVAAQRQAYTGPIRIKLEGLPAGLSAPETELRAGQNSVVIPIQAAADAKAAPARIRVVGTATVDGKTLQRTAEGAERYQPPLTNQPQQMRVRPTRMTVAAVGPPPPFTVAPTAPAAAIKVEQKLEVPVGVTRTASFKDPVVLTLVGLPAQVQAPALTLKPTESQGKIAVTVAKNAAPGDYPVVLQGVGKGVLVAAPLTLTIQPAK